MPRFFNEESSDDEESDQDVEVEAKPAPAKRGAARTLQMSDDEDEATEKRVVRSQKDKKAEELQTTIKSIRNKIKQNDWNTGVAEFDSLMTKQLPKALAILQKEGQELPEEFFELLIHLEETAKKTLDNKVKLSPTNQKSLKSLQVKLRKINKTYEKQIKALKEKSKKEAEKEEEGEEEEEEEKEEVEKKKGKKEEEKEETPSKASKPAETKPAAKTGRSRFLKDDKKDEEEDEEDESSDDESDDDKGGAKVGLSKWIKKKDDQKPAAATPAKRIKTVKEGGKGGKKKGGKEEAAVATPAKGDAEFTKEEIDKKLREIISSRGKKGIDRQKQIERLSELATKAKTLSQEIEILLDLISAQFDVTPSAATHMPTALWRSTYKHLAKVLEILEGMNTSKSPEYQTLLEGPTHGSLLGFVERLDDELTKSYQNIDPHTQEYVERLQDESTFIELVDKVYKYFGRINKSTFLARVGARRIEHLYYKREENKSKSDSSALIQKMANIIYQHGDERLKTRAALCHIYNLALRDNFYVARDTLLVSHLQESINTAEIPTQILFNRTMVQLGLCAFRLGLISEAHACLADIYAGGRVKELLAQGLSSTRFGEKNPDQEKQERRRQVPYHMHINLELLECVHHVSAMLLEVPNMAANAFDVKKKVISRPYRRLLDFFDRQVFTGPPENTRDFVVHAGKALSSGDWKRSVDLLLSLQVWNLLPNTEQIKTMLRRKIQEEGLRTHLFSFGSFYDSFSLEELSTIFDLPKNTVHSLISKMIINEELHASWDQPTGSIVMHKVEPTRLQALALQLSEKATQVVEFNERLLDIRMGGYKFDGKPGDKRFPSRGGAGGRGGYRGGARQGSGGDGERREGGGRGRGGYRGGSGGGGGQQREQREQRGGQSGRQDKGNRGGQRSNYSRTNA